MIDFFTKKYIIVGKRRGNMKDKSLAMELIKDYKKSNENMFKIIIILIICWLLTIGGIIFYSCLHSEETTQEANGQEITQEVNK